MKIVNIKERNLLNDFKNFIGTFRKNVAYDKNKSHKITRVSSSL